MLHYFPNAPGVIKRRLELANRMMDDPDFAQWVAHIEAMMKARGIRSFGKLSAQELLVAMLEQTKGRAG